MQCSYLRPLHQSVKGSAAIWSSFMGLYSEVSGDTFLFIARSSPFQTTGNQRERYKPYSRNLTRDKLLQLVQSNISQRKLSYHHYSMCAWLLLQIFHRENFCRYPQNPWTLQRLLKVYGIWLEFATHYSSLLTPPLVWVLRLVSGTVNKATLPVHIHVVDTLDKNVAGMKQMAEEMKATAVDKHGTLSKG